MGYPMICTDETIQPKISFNLHKFVHTTINNHKQRGFKIKITKQDLKLLIKEALENGCPYCGKPFNLKDNHSDYYPSIDILNPKIRQMSKENVQILCNRCNTLKRNIPHLEFIEICNNITKRYFGNVSPKNYQKIGASGGDLHFD